MPKIKLRMPNITGKNEKERIEQINSYLRYLVTELQWAFDTIETTEIEKKQEEK